MGRQVKTGLEYFPVETSCINQRRMRRLSHEFGTDAIALYFTLLCDIHENGYSLIINDDYLFDTSLLLGIEKDNIMPIIHAMIDLGYFDKKMFDELGILTSVSIQQTYKYVKKGCKSNKIDDKVCLIEQCDHAKKDKENDDSNQEKSKYRSKKAQNEPESVISALGKAQNDVLSRQRKEKESKEKESKGKKTTSSSQARMEAEDISSSQSIEEIRKELLDDEDWKASVCMLSGKGIMILNLLPAAMNRFECHITSIGQKSEISKVNDYKRRFINWWRSVDFLPPDMIPSNSLQRVNNCGAAQPKLSNVERALNASKVAAEMTKEILRRNNNGLS